MRTGPWVGSKLDLCALLRGLGSIGPFGRWIGVLRDHSRNGQDQSVARSCGLYWKGRRAARALGWVGAVGDEEIGERARRELGNNFGAVRGDRTVSGPHLLSKVPSLVAHHAGWLLGRRCRLLSVCTSRL